MKTKNSDTFGRFHGFAVVSERFALDISGLQHLDFYGMRINTLKILGRLPTKKRVPI
ncbi:MAG: hypothetical protein ACOWYE_13945 [Desulfatiglandales bacterium]